MSKKELIEGLKETGDINKKNDVESTSKEAKLTSIFAFAEELRITIQKEIDVFEINEVNYNSSFYETIMKEKVKVE